MTTALVMVLITAAKEPWSVLDIADGSANAYHFKRSGTKVDFEYVPVKPEESSSGTYSGGPPRRETLDAGDKRLNELWATLQKLEADKSKQQAERGMGTARIAWADGAGVKHDFIVKMGPDVTALVEQLKRFGQSR